MTTDLITRHLTKVRYGPAGDTSCWPWTGNIGADGYGRTSSKTTRLAHRFTYQLFKGPIPDGHVIDHTCHDPDTCTLNNACPHRSCQNPAHLEAVTIAVNIQRSGAPSQRTIRTGICAHGHNLNDTGVYIRKDGRRRCRLCSIASVQRAKRIKREPNP